MNFQVEARDDLAGELLDEQVGLIAGFDRDWGPIPLFDVHDTMPPGTWSMRCALEDPLSGSIQAESFSPFEVQ